MKIILTGTLKGGPGKTLITFNSAGMIAERKKVLLVDGDPQFNLSSNMGIDVRKEGLKTIRDVFESEGTISANEVICRNSIPELPNLAIIPSSMLLTATELKLVSLAGRERIFLNFIKKNFNIFKEFDYIFIDVNPNMGMINQNLLLAADHVILPCDIDIDSVDGAEFFIALWETIRNRLGKEDNISALILNNADMRSNLYKELYEYCQDKEDLSHLLLPHIIPASIVLKNTKLKRKPVNIMAVNSKNRDAHRKALNSIETYVQLLEKRGIL